MMCYITSIELSISEERIQIFLDKVSLPKLNENQTHKCEGAITEYEILKALTSMDKDKSPGNDSITKEFCINFRDVVKESLFASIEQSFIADELKALFICAVLNIPSISKESVISRTSDISLPLSLINQLLTYGT